MSSKMNTCLSQILPLFSCKSQVCTRNIASLIQESCMKIGEDQTLQKIQQWKRLSQKLSNNSKLSCLSDINHRQMLLEFIRQEAVSLYKSSYFNRAKIDQSHLYYLRLIGPYFFAEVMTIVNKLKLIYKHFSLNFYQKKFSQNHIDIKIAQILEICGSSSRNINNNLNKFKSIVQFQEDREGLTKQLGKMLRVAWSNQKKMKPIYSNTKSNRSRLDIESIDLENELSPLNRAQIQSSEYY